MQSDFLRGTALVGGALFALMTAACGGKVIVDGYAGAGGNGGGNSTSTSPMLTGPSGPVSTGSSPTGPSTVNSSVSTGANMVASVGAGPTTCGCNEFCATLKMCGGPTNNCQQLCANQSADTLQCVCNVGGNCQGLKGCFGGPGTGGGPGGAGTGGGPQSPACTMCAGNAAKTMCSNDVSTCQQTPGCMSVLNCHNKCGFGPNCNFCDMKGKAATDAFDALIQCAVCDSCGGPCGADPVFQACGGGGAPPPGP